MRLDGKDLEIAENTRPVRRESLERRLHDRALESLGAIEKAIYVGGRPPFTNTVKGSVQRWTFPISRSFIELRNGMRKSWSATE